jgi:hypothetical protein
MQSLILNLKGSLLPLLNITNSILDKFKWVVDKLGGVESGFVQTLAGITLALGTFSVLKGVFSPLTGLVGALKSGITSKGGGIAEQIGSSGTSDLTGKNGASPAGTTANYARAASIAAIGVAAVGIGYGIKLAAEGFTGLGDSMAKMDIETKNKLLTAMGITALGLVVPIIAIGIAGEKSALGLLALGAAAVGVGAGMKLFAEGYNIFSNPKIPDLNSLNILKTINFDTMKTAFVEANNFLKGDSSNLDKLKNQLEDLRVNFNLGVDNLTKELKTLNDKGITARFDKSEASINITIENIIDGEKIVSKNSRTVAIEISNTKKGKSAFSF